MKIVLEIDEKTPLKDGDLLVYDGGKVKSLKKTTLLRDVVAENAALKKEIKVLKIKIINLAKVVKEIAQMKKIILLGLLFVLGVAKPQTQVVWADEPETSEIAEETPETSEIDDVVIDESTLTVEELPEWVKVVFSPALIATIISVLGMIGTVVKLASDLKKLKSVQSLSNSELLNKVESKILPLIDKALKENAARLGQDNVKNYDQYKAQTEKLMKVLTLSQENTPEARVAILQILTGDVDAKLIEKAKETIEVQEQEKVDKKVELNEIVDEVLDEVLGEDDLIDKL